MHTLFILGSLRISIPRILNSDTVCFSDEDFHLRLFPSMHAAASGGERLQLSNADRNIQAFLLARRAIIEAIVFLIDRFYSENN